MMPSAEAQRLFNTWVHLSMACVKIEAGRKAEWVLQLSGTCGLTGHSIAFSLRAEKLEDLWPQVMESIEFTDAELEQLRRLAH